jgi:hypothetical protein
MGRDPSARFDFIQSRASTIVEKRKSTRSGAALAWPHRSMRGTAAIDVVAMHSGPDDHPARSG